MHATDQPRRLFFGLRFACCQLWLSSVGRLVPVLAFLLEVRRPARSHATFLAGFAVELLFCRATGMVAAMHAAIDVSGFVPRLM